MDEKAGTLMVDVDLDYVEKIRNEFPMLKHRRSDLYQINMIGKDVK